ncbi:hypothetical protein H1W00_02610 [Aeromicrobium sp. Marseille-Q0843]|uniref:Streptogrisin C n=1 Tax=Aeromicrobium phoceense TaxID=2754045 RepID=A0A838X790_9ACTN|nr:hypothetical protein [Aeromicrobium phoceense]MBA4607359.1 hypothetical protein [Aeromicrobium phoceense]
MKRFVVLASIAPLLLIPAGAVALPSGLPSPDDSVTELEAKDDTVVTSIPDGVSLDDIRTAENTEKLTTALHDILGYEASLQAGSDPSTVVLNWKGEVPAELAELQQNPPAGTELIIRKSKYSEDELRKAGAALLLNARAKSGEPLIAYVTPAEDFSGLKASVRGEADDTRSTNELEADLERIAGTPVTIRSRQASVTGLARQNDSSPWFGAGIMRKDSTNSTCSLGVAAVTPGGYGRLISAAHCDPGGNAAWRTAAGTLITSGGTNVTVRHPSIDAMRIDPEGGTSPKVWSGGYGSSSSR